ncbi:IclR family transcriptional regulator [Bordetella sputigena]|uniref:IclR family transcriptional regulator n=1 Tax=Bordetella sputigena TaxID=1416810 RepID=UPI0039F0392F
MDDAPIDKTLMIMEAVAASRRPLSVTEIAELTGLAMPTTHRLVVQLIDRNVLARHLSSKRVMPGARLTRLGIDAVQTSLNADQPHALLKALTISLGEFAQISMVVDGELVCVDAAAVRRPGGLHLEQGNRGPLHCTSIGKLHLAHMPEDALAQWFRSSTRRKFTNRTLTSETRLRAHFNEIRAQGWASCNEEWNAGVVGVGVRLPLRSNAFIGLCVSAPTARMDYETMVDKVPVLREYAAEIALAFEASSGG